jgi:hypothetical protein
MFQDASVRTTMIPDDKRLHNKDFTALNCNGTAHTKNTDSSHAHIFMVRYNQTV